MVAEGDKVVVHWTNHGTSLGGEEINESAVSVYRIANGKIAEDRGMEYKSADNTY